MLYIKILRDPQTQQWDVFATANTKIKILTVYDTVHGKLTAQLHDFRGEGKKIMGEVVTLA